MKIVVFGLSITSSWGNGHATLWRGLCRGLRGHGHEVVFFERDVPYYAAHRDFTESEDVDVVLYSCWPEIAPRAEAELSYADVGIVTSYCPDSLPATGLLAGSTAFRVFYDLDTPVSLARLKAGKPVEYFGPNGLRDFDLVLSFTGGPALKQLRTMLNARRVAPLYGSVDPAVHCSTGSNPDYECDLSYLGTYAADRQNRLDEMFLEPAKKLSNRSFLLGGSQYPADLPQLANLRRLNHVSPHEHSAFYSSSRATLNITRRDMAESGFCPSGRLFEAAACGTPILTDWWEGLDEFFTPGKEILVARSGAEAMEIFSLSDNDLNKIGTAARQRTLIEHTSAVRAAQLERILESN
jgi:spore maturation protein CgeB